MKGGGAMLGLFSLSNKKSLDTAGKYSAMDIANYILERGTKENYQLSNLQLQKILYYVQRDFLQKENYALFSDEVEAWQFGPVVSRVYYNFCAFGAMDIYYLPTDVPELADSEKRRINAIVDEKRKVLPWELVADTHAPKKAWSLIYRGGLGYKNVIPKEVIARYG